MVANRVAEDGLCVGRVLAFPGRIQSYFQYIYTVGFAYLGSAVVCSICMCTEYGVVSPETQGNTEYSVHNLLAARATSTINNHIYLGICGKTAENDVFKALVLIPFSLLPLMLPHPSNPKSEEGRVGHVSGPIHEQVTADMATSLCRLRGDGASSE